ncbi:hypothetical protein [Polynucleobacter sp.]|uniref:hypothetical protein n=1 Tax=Polynucleobacter sp. TaxID=2029855 RepID=UPI003F69FD6E
MSNAEQVAYNNMLREIEGLSYGVDVQDDAAQWLDVKLLLPPTSRMVWAACPNAVLCAYQTFLLYLDSDGQWRDNTGCLFARKVAFWQYADVPTFKGSC